MKRIYYLVLITATYNVTYVYSSPSDTVHGIPETFSHLTSGNDLWSSLLKYCMPPTFNCVRNNIYAYLKRTLDYPSDIQFTSFLKFPRNTINYGKAALFEENINETNEDINQTPTFNDSTPLEEMSRSLTENTKRFFMTHDVELQLPETFFMGTTIKVSPRSFEDHGALVKLEIDPKSIKDPIGEGRIFIKKISK